MSNGLLPDLRQICAPLLLLLEVLPPMLLHLLRRLL